MTQNVAVFGVGNVLLRDDGVGPTVVHHLNALWKFPEGVVVEDLGTPDLGLAGRMIGYQAVIFVDAVSADEAPGTVRIYRRDELMKHPPGLRLSPHDPSLKETIATLEFTGNGPEEISLVGIVPATLDGGTGLSEEVEDALPFATEAVLAELLRLGVTPRPRTVALPLRTWWEPAPKP
jgi:hydrogenase maturation protease